MAELLLTLHVAVLMINVIDALALLPRWAIGVLLLIDSAFLAWLVVEIA